MPYYYLIIFLILMFCACCEIYGMNRRTSKIITFTAFFLVFSTAGFKYETGIDWRVYDAIFYLQWPIGKILDFGIVDFFSQFGFEPGYILLTSIIKECGGSIQTVFFIVALINIILFYKSLNYFSKYPIFCLLGYYCFVFFILDMSGIRQAIALNIVLYTMRFALERKWWKYFIGILIASTFHQTAIFLVIIYPLFYKQQLKTKYLLTAYICSLLIVLLKIKWLQSIALIALPILGFNSNLSEKMVNYIFSSDYDDPSLSIVKIAFVLSVIFYTYFYRERFLNDTLSKFCYLCLILFAIINNLMFELSEVNTRLSAYLIIFIILAISNIISKSSIKKNKLIISVITLLYCYLYCSVYLLEKPSTIAYSPYQNYIIYKILDIRSTGEDRLDKFSSQ